MGQHRRQNWAQPCCPRCVSRAWRGAWALPCDRGKKLPTESSEEYRTRSLTDLRLHLSLFRLRFRTHCPNVHQKKRLCQRTPRALGLALTTRKPCWHGKGFRTIGDGSTLKEMDSRGVFCHEEKWYEVVDMHAYSCKLSGPFEMTQHPETYAPLRIGWVSALKMIAHFKVAGEAPPYTTLADYQRACTFEPGKGFMVGIRTPWMLFLSLVYGYESTLSWRWQRELWCSRPLEGNFEAWEANPNNVLPLIPPP